MWKCYEIQISESINKILWEYNHTILYVFVLQEQNLEVAMNALWFSKPKY